MKQAQCELKAAGKPYPRTCPVCGISGICKMRDTRIFRNMNVMFEGRRDHMNALHKEGEYIALSAVQDDFGRQSPLNMKIPISQAEALARDILKALKNA